VFSFLIFATRVPGVLALLEMLSRDLNF